MRVYQLYYDWTNYIRLDDDDVWFVLVRHALGFYSASPLKQQFTGRHDAPLGHIIPIPSQTFGLKRHNVENVAF